MTDSSRLLASRFAVIALVIAAAALGTVVSARDALWSDETLSLRVWGLELGHYDVVPGYPFYLILGRKICADTLFLHVWSMLPWLFGLLVVHRLASALGASPRRALAAVALLAFNPFLVRETSFIRYYGLFLACSVTALWATVVLLDHRPRSRWMRVALVLAILSPISTAHSGFLISVPLLLYLLAKRWNAWSVRARTVMGVGIVALLAAVLLVQLESVFDWLQYQRTHTPSRPLDIGYRKAPADGWSLAYQYEKLLGWHVFAPWFGTRVVGALASLLCAASLIVFGLFSRCRHRTLIVALTLVPAGVWAISPLANAIGARHYLFSAVPLTLVVVEALATVRSWSSSRLSGMLPFIFLFAITAVAQVPALRYSATSSLDRLCEQAERNDIQELVVFPEWYCRHLRDDFARRGMTVSVIGMESAAPWPDPPEWLFVLEPFHTWEPSIVGAREICGVDRMHYDEVLRLESLNKYYFHPPIQVDRLLRRSREPE